MKITRIEDIDKHKIVLDGCMVTYTGIVFDLMNPDINLICLEDIAHGLAFNCRWNGATKSYYSIAEHSLRVSEKCTGVKKLTGLFHDAEEAYWGDMIRPLKALIKEKYPEIIKKMIDIHYMIFQKYNIPNLDVDEEDWSELVCDFDELILNNRKTMLPHKAEKMWIKNVYRLLK